jgi:hypothetical protein
MSGVISNVGIPVPSLAARSGKGAAGMAESDGLIADVGHQAGACWAGTTVAVALLQGARSGISPGPAVLLCCVLPLRLRDWPIHTSAHESGACMTFAGT